MKICLCGSTRFKAGYEAINRELSKTGQVVYSVSGFHHADGEELTDEDKETLDLVHLLKIQESDAIVVIGEDADGKPYVGASTKREIKWAEMLGKVILFEHQIWDKEKRQLKEVSLEPGPVVQE